MNDGDMVIDIIGCARCGQDHKELAFRVFDRPPDDETSHFGICPTNLEPIMLGVVRK